MNTLVVACFNCVISTCFVLMVAYAISCCRFKGRKLLQNLSVTVNLFPGVLAMIAVYFVLKYMNLTNSYAGLIMVYAGSSGLGYLICKGFFDTVPVALREAAKLDGASEARIFFQIVIPMSRPILVYTIINSFLTVSYTHLMVTMNRVRQNLGNLVFLSLMNIAIKMPPKKLVKVAKNAQTNVQVKTLAKE